MMPSRHGRSTRTQRHSPIRAVVREDLAAGHCRAGADGIDFTDASHSTSAVAPADPGPFGGAVSGL